MNRPLSMTMDADHPLAGPLADGRIYDRWFRVHMSAPAPSLAEVCTDRDALRGAVETKAHRHGTQALHIGASFLLGHTTWALLGPLAVSYLATRRVPIVEPCSIGGEMLDAGDGPVRISLATTSFAALRSDPAAAHPDAMAVEDDEALRAVFRLTAASLGGVLATSLRPWSRQSSHSQWGALSDALATALCWAGRAIDDERAGADEAEAVLDGTPPFWGRINTRRVEGAAGTRRILIRNTCCLAYQLERARYCTNCPLSGDERRHGRLGAGCTPRGVNPA